MRPPPGERTVALDWLSIPKKARKEMGKADRESEKNKPKQTIEHLRKAIKIHPKFYQAYNNLAVQHLRLRQKLNLGIIRLQEQDYWGSYGWLRKAFELDPNDLQTELFLGQNCYHLGLYLRALNRFQNVARQNPEAAGPYLWMGQCHLLLRRYKEALSEFERFVAIEPDFDNVKVTRFGGE